MSSRSTSFGEGTKQDCIRDWAEGKGGLGLSQFLGSSGPESILQKCPKLETRTGPSCPLSLYHGPGIDKGLPGMRCHLDRPSSQLR